MTAIDAPTQASRAKRLKAATTDTRDRLDKRIMAGDIFASRERFARFLQVQYRFHRDIDALYARTDLSALLPDLQRRRRMGQIASDLSDLGHPLPPTAPGRLGIDTPLPTALGWLYVAEGSNLGGTILFKLASQKLGLNADFGARHLAAHPDGAARHWREFTAALDGLDLAEAQDSVVIAGAEDAFRTVHGYVDEVFA